MKSADALPTRPFAGTNEPIYTVSQLNREVRELLDDALPMLLVEGEISNFRRPGSGHFYFSLKDDAARVDCAMFRNANQRLTFSPEDGLAVLVRARAGLYEPQGRFQLIVEHMEPAGEGLLLRRLEQLKARLAGEGLFAAEHKRPLPELPRRIGVITSPSGAAVRDILHILGRRFPAVPVVIYPSAVQGEAAQHELAAALSTAGARGECDVLILARGGGSLEDLWAFNEEKVARAIFDCPLPVVSAVGHETDFTIADLVADRRAPTPSGAAEIVVPDARDWLAGLRRIERSIGSAAQRLTRLQRASLTTLLGRLARRHPGELLRQRAQRIDELMQRAGASLRHRTRLDRSRLATVIMSLRAGAPLESIRERRRTIADRRARMRIAVQARIAELQKRLAVGAAELQTVSPLGTLERGYAVIQDAATGAVIRDATRVRKGQKIKAKLARGTLDATVDKTSKG